MNLTIKISNDAVTITRDVAIMQAELDHEETDRRASLRTMDMVAKLIGDDLKYFKEQSARHIQNSCDQIASDGSVTALERIMRKLNIPV